MGCGVFCFVLFFKKKYFFFFLAYKLCKLHPKTTLHDPFLCALILSLASYFLSYWTKVIIKKGFSVKGPHWHRKSPCAQRGGDTCPLLSVSPPWCRACRSTIWPAVICQESFLHTCSVSLAWLKVCFSHLGGRRDGPPL